MPLRPRWIGYKPGDAVTVIVSEVGLNSQKVLLTNREIDPGSGCPVFTARSETDAKHPFALGETTVAPPTPGVTAPPDIPAPDADAWEITATAITVGDTSLPALVIDGAIDSTSTDSIFFEYRESVGGDGDDDGWIAAGLEPPTTTRKVINGVKPGVDYEVSVSYRRFGSIGDRVILGPVTVGQLTLAEIEAIADDNILSRGEKPRVVQDYLRILSEQGGIDARATAQGITTQKTSYDNAVTALTSYLGGLSPAYNDYDQDTAITRTAFISAFNNVETARQALLNQIDKTAYDMALQAIADAQNAQDTADGKIDTYYQNSAPSGASEGDLWFDTDDANKLYTRRSGAWILTADTRVAAAITAAAGAQATADGKVTTFYTTSTPTATALGDLWYSSSTNLLKRWNGSSWVNVATIGADWATNLTSVPTALTDGRVDAGLNSDGTIKTSKVPTLAVQVGALATRAAIRSTSTVAGTGSTMSMGTIFLTIPTGVSPSNPMTVMLQGFAAMNYVGTPPSTDFVIALNGIGAQMGSGAGAGIAQSVLVAARMGGGLRHRLQRLADRGGRVFLADAGGDAIDEDRRDALAGAVRGLDRGARLDGLEHLEHLRRLDGIDRQRAEAGIDVAPHGDDHVIAVIGRPARVRVDLPVRGLLPVQAALMGRHPGVHLLQRPAAVELKPSVGDALKGVFGGDRRGLGRQPPLDRRVAALQKVCLRGIAFAAGIDQR